jgi:hypothetical protein
VADLSSTSSTWLRSKTWQSRLLGRLDLGLDIFRPARISRVGQGRPAFEVAVDLVAHHERGDRLDAVGVRLGIGPSRFLAVGRGQTGVGQAMESCDLGRRVAGDTGAQPAGFEECDRHAGLLEEGGRDRAGDSPADDRNVHRRFTFQPRILPFRCGGGDPQ